MSTIPTEFTVAKEGPHDRAVAQHYRSSIQNFDDLSPENWSS